MAARGDARGPVLGGEVDERDDRRDLHLRVGPREVDPHGFVAVEDLLLRARAALEDVRDVQLVRRAARQQHRIAHTAVHGMGEDLRGEDARLARDTGDVARPGAEEPLDHVVHERSVLREQRALEERIDLRVEPTEEVGVEEVLHDHRAVLGERVDDALGRGGGGDPLEAHPLNDTERYGAASDARLSRSRSG